MVPRVSRLGFPCLARLNDRKRDSERTATKPVVSVVKHKQGTRMVLYSIH
jgi:hypothetical protein